MKNVWYTFCAEWKKLFWDKALFLWSLLIIIIAFGASFLYIGDLGIEMQPPDVVENPSQWYEVNRDAAYESYLSVTHHIEDAYVDSYDLHAADYYYEQYLYYDFLIRTNTYSDDYVDLNNLSGVKDELQNSVMMLRFSSYLPYVLAILSIVVAFYTFASEKQRGTWKNIFATSAPRQSVYFGKSMFMHSINFVIVMIALAIGLFLGKADSAPQALMCIDNKMVTVSCLKVYLIRLFCYALLMCSLSSITAFSAQLFKRLRDYVALPIGIYALSAAVYTRFYRSFCIPTSINVSKYFPLMGLQFCVPLFTVGTILVIIMHLLCTAALTYLGCRKFIKKDFE